MNPQQRPHPPASTPKRWVRVLLAAGVGELGIVLLVLGWNTALVVDASPDTAPHQRAIPRPSPVRAALLAPVQDGTLAPGLPLRSKGNAASTTPDRSEVEICGFGTVTLRPDDPYPFQAIPLAVRESALATVEALMLASDDIQVRAAALWIGIRRGKRDARTRIEQVARLAIGSRDPVVYALAIEACKGWTADDYGSCHLISHAQWAHLDPDNAVPWLEVAAQARHNNDAEGEEMATRMATYARHTDTREGLLPTLVDRAMGTRVTPLQRTLALSESWSAQAVWAASHALYRKAGAVTPSGPPSIGLDLSCHSVNRMQDWMHQRHTLETDGHRSRQ